MYAIKTQSVIWVSHNGGRRNFISTYILPDGFATKSEAADKVYELGLLPFQFRYVRILGQWYAVFLDQYFKGIVLSEEEIAYFTKPYAGYARCSYEQFDPSPFQGIEFLSGKQWTDGIAFDLSLTELGTTGKSKTHLAASEILVESLDTGSEMFGADRINCLVSLGLPYYYTAVKMDSSDPSYVQRIFLHFYKPVNCEKEMIAASMFSYYNPILHIGYDSKNMADKEKDRILKELGVKPADIPLFARKWYEDAYGNRYKFMREKEVNWKTRKNMLYI